MNLLILKAFFGIVFHFFLNLFFKKIEIFKDDLSSSNHKKLAVNNDNILLTGGLSVLILLFIFLEANYYFKLFCCLIFVIGVISDLNFISSPFKRFIFQAVAITFFIIQFNNNIDFTDIAFLDLILKYKIISYIFTIYCFLIIVNGTNFIDGLNGLVIGYYILSFTTLLILLLTKNINYDYSTILVILIILLINYPFNLIGKNFLGDSGSYLIAFIAGYIFVDFYKTYSDVSALFIVILLWYPAFENLFSIIRKKIIKKNPSEPDTNHIHQLIFKYLINKFENKKKANIFSSLIINFYNSVVFLIALFLFNNSSGLSVLLTLIVIIYINFYLFLLRKIESKI